MKIGIAILAMTLVASDASSQKLQKHWLCQAADGSTTRVTESATVGYCERDPEEPDEGSRPKANLHICASPSGNLTATKIAIQGETCRVMTMREVRNEFPELVPSAAAVLAGKQLKLFCSSQPGAACSDPESGLDEGTLMGAKFTVYSDSATVAGSPETKLSPLNPSTWSLACMRDKMTNRKTCHAHKGELWIFFPQAGGAFVSIGTDHFPGSQSSIRIGARRFDTMNRDGNFNQRAILPLLKDGTIVVTRFMKWPHRSWIDDEFKLHGVQATLALGRWMVKHAETYN